MIEIIGKLSGEDLQRFRAVEVRRRALERNPDAYSAAETEQIVLSEIRMDAEIADRHAIDPRRHWMVSAVDGTVAYGKEWDD